ncbi:cyclin-like protein [Flagelloscypha sp. PMI_526]|nr:cyclin-like protein [Flagelloscypha sp. PMI_526]
MGSTSEWLFTPSMLDETPSRTHTSLFDELYLRATGVEFLYRLGGTLRLPTAALFTAANWFHRFYMRYDIDDFPTQETAAACVFLATKTEECSRKLRDVALVAEIKRTGGQKIPDDSPEIQKWCGYILWVEEYLLEAIGFDFTVDMPHFHILHAVQRDRDRNVPPETLKDIQESAWSLAHDSYRTPLCILFPAPTIAAACYILAQRLIDGPNSPSLDARISLTNPRTSLPTPPSHQPSSPSTHARILQEFGLDDAQLGDVADVLVILLDFYQVQSEEWLSGVKSVSPPTVSTVTRLYQRPAPSGTSTPAHDALGRTPNSSHGGNTPNPLKDEAR